MANTPNTADIPVITSNDVPPEGGAPVKEQLAQTEITQATGFKAKKSIITREDGSSVTEYRIDVEGTHTTATIAADGSAILSTTRGRVSGAAEPGDAEKNFGAALGTALKHAPSGTAPQQEAKDLAEVMEKAFADGKISPTEIANMTAINDTAQNLPARGPRTSITR